MPNFFSRLDFVFLAGVGARGWGRGSGNLPKLSSSVFFFFFFFRVAVFCFGWLAFFLKVDFFFSGWLAFF